MQPLYLARIEDLGRGDFVRVDRTACHHVALLTPEFLLRLGLSPWAKVLDLKARVRCRGCGARGQAVVSISGHARVREPALAAIPWRYRRRGGEIAPFADPAKIDVSPTGGPMVRWTPKMRQLAKVEPCP
jgi:hypothetical protein